jgi:hypothetical protein
MARTATATVVGGTSIPPGALSNAAMVRAAASTGRPVGNLVAPLVESPERRLERALEQLDTLALPLLSAQVGRLDAAGVEASGTSIAVLWLAIESAAAELLAPASTGRTAATQPPATQPPPMPPPPTAERAARVAEVVRVREAARTRIFRALSSQYWRGRPVTHEAPLPAPAPDQALQILTASRGLAWLLRDTAALAELLARGSLPEVDQWTAVGLRRQHLNPWDARFITAVLAEHGLDRAFASFAPGPRQALAQLDRTVEELARGQRTAPGQEVGAFELRPMDGTIRLLQPMSPEEVAEQLYGRTEDAATVLAPFNRDLLGGRDTKAWLDPGIVLVVYAERLVPPYQLLFRAAEGMRAQRQRQTGEPYLWTHDEEPLAVGNTFTVGVDISNALFAPKRLHWWVDNDPSAVRDHGLPARVDIADGMLDMDRARSENSQVSLIARAPGNHRVRCRLTSNDGSDETVSRLVTVVTLGEKTDLAVSRQLGWSRRPDQLLADLREQRERTPADSQERSALDTRIAEVQRSLDEAQADARRYGSAAHLSGVRGVYVSAEDRPMTVALNVFVDSDPGYFDATDYHLTLWDYTLPGHPATYHASGERPQEALRSLLRTFADDAPYPAGTMRFEITPLTMGYAGLYREAVTYPTDGGTAMVPILRGLSMGVMAVGVIAAFAMQPEVALPAFAISGALAGAAGGVSIYERLEHGQFEWDLQTGMDLLDIAAALLTLGTVNAGTTAVAGVGRMTMSARFQLAIGGVQLGVMAGTHVAAITTAIASGDRDAVARELLSALADGALVLVVHRATTRLGRGAPGRAPTVTERPPVAEHPPARPGAEHPPTKPTAPPGSPEYLRQLHEGWAADTRAQGLAVREATPPSSTAPAVPGDEFRDIRSAQQAYEDLLGRNPDREVGIYRNPDTGAYSVRQGGAFEVSPPKGGRWEPVMHYHPNEANVLTHRMPAPNDVQGAALRARRTGASVTEFIDFRTPDGRRGRSSYTVSPNGRVEVDFVRADGTRVNRPFADVHEYQRAYGSRTTFLDPASPEYQWVRADLDEMYAGRAPEEGRQTATGVVAPPPKGTVVPGPDVAALRTGHAETLVRRPELAREAAALEDLVRTAGPTDAGVQQRFVELQQRIRRLATVDATSAAPTGATVVELSWDRDAPNYWERRTAQVPDPPVVLEFPDGSRVWRETPHGPVRHEATIGSSLGRADLERAMYSMTQHGRLPAGIDWERAHALGQGTGFESPYHILYAPEYVNQELQNRGIEAYMRTLAEGARPGEQFRVRTRTQPHLGTERLAFIEYQVVLVGDGAVTEIATYRIDVTKQPVMVTAGPLRYANNPTAGSVAARGGLPSLLSQTVSRTY